MSIKRTAQIGFSALVLLVSGCSDFSGGVSSREIKNPEIRNYLNAMADRKISQTDNPYELIDVFDLYRVARNVKGMWNVVKKMPQNDTHTVKLLQDFDAYLESHPEDSAEKEKLLKSLSSD